MDERKSVTRKFIETKHFQPSLGQNKHLLETGDSADAKL